MLVARQSIEFIGMLPVVASRNCGGCRPPPGNKASLAIAMAGLVMDHAYQGRMREASRLASEAMALIESLGDPTLTVGLSFPAIYAKTHSGEWSDVLRWSQRAIDLADGDPRKGNFIFGSQRRGLRPVTAWVVPTGATTCTTAWPWPTGPTP
jgi:hypothetical protein